MAEGIRRTDVTLEAMKQVAQDTQLELSAEQRTAKEAFFDSVQEMVNPFAAKFGKKRKKIKSHAEQVREAKKAEDKGEKVQVERYREGAEHFERKNPELKARSLLLLRERIKPGSKVEDILKEVLDMYPDVSLADEAIEFLLETTEGELFQQVQQTKEELREKFEREILAGKNIHAEARSAASKGLGTPTSMREMYRDITGNPRDSNALFQELSTKYSFKELKPVVDFLLHSLGSDLKAKGSSIPRGELHRLLTETRSLQAILGVYRFFKGRMRLMKGLFEKNGLNMPDECNFEEMSKEFMILVGERYPSAGKVNERMVPLGIERWLVAKIIVLSQMRDAIREVAMKQVYRSLQHRDDLYMALIEALEELEDQLEELEEQEEEEEEEV